MGIKLYISPLILFYFILNGVFYSQMPAKPENKVGFKKSVVGGVILHTQGLGINFNYLKFKTFEKQRIYTVDFVSLKSLKENKIRSVIAGKNSKMFVYGKMNSLFVLRAGIGERRMKYEKIRESGVEVSFNWSAGLSLGMAKPEYLEIVHHVSGDYYDLSIEKYDPEKHDLSNINGKGPFGRGVSEMKFYPGGFFKTSVNFEYSSERDLVRAIEVGFVLDGYATRIPVMTTIENSFFYPTFYLNLQFGQKYI